MYLGLLYPGSGGFNSIRGNYSGSKYLVDNNSGVTVKAQENHWGSSSPVSAMFDGTVNSTYHFSYNPTSGSGNGHDGQTPSKVASGGMDFIAAYEQAESDLETAKTTQEVKDGLYRLYQLAGLSGDESLKKRFNQLASDVSTGANRLYNSDNYQKTLQHSAMILQAKSLVRDQKYEELAGYLNQAEASVLQGMDRRDWLHLSAVSQTYQGEYKQALQTIQSFKAHQEAQSIPAEDYEYVHQMLEEDIRLLLKEEADPEAPKTEDLLVSETDSQELTVQNYPNPFNPTTNISFTLPKKSNVTLVIYDMLGREVATLVNGILSAGEQTVTFDASNLSNGMYLYKLQTGEHQIVKKMTLIK